MTSDDNIRDYYRQRAAEYEQIYYRDIPKRRQEIADEETRLKELTKGKTVLDTPCGTGYWTYAASQTAKAVVASDLLPEMITEAAAKPYPQPVQFVLSDLHHLPFADGSFDIITLGFWLSHHRRQDFENLFRSLGRIIKADGLVWMIDNNPPAEGPGNHSEGTDKFGNNLKKRFLNDGREYVIIKNYFSENELRKIFSSFFTIQRLTFGNYYWSAVLAMK
jgi:ubiquinone/menaquinone biosynthesis C-methylase UbiE